MEQVWHTRAIFRFATSSYIRIEQFWGRAARASWIRKNPDARLILRRMCGAGAIAREKRAEDTARRDLAGVYWEWSKKKRKFVISCGDTGTILYYPRPPLRCNRCKRKDFWPSLPHLGRRKQTEEAAEPG